MNVTQLIARKRDGGKLSDGEIADLIASYVSGDVPDYQMAALAMAIYLRGMSGEETASLTRHMLHSGVTLEWEPGPPMVDKHSTGGIGDKVSLILAPLLACCDVRVPMISGRGLGPTGGTLDKLESIVGFRTDLSIDEIRRQVEDVGCVITGATADLVPADRKLYALRDVTATVSCLPLITASIMSKKLAEGLDALVLDVKWGSGAFMKTLGDARTLACSMVDVGNRLGVATTALITSMNQPLGRMVGHSCEVEEAIAVLKGEGPADVGTLTLELAADVLLAAGVVNDREDALTSLAGHLDSGRAYEKFVEMVTAQGGTRDEIVEFPMSHPLTASRPGFVQSIDTEALGYAIIELGGGRKLQTDRIDDSVGLEMHVRIGDEVQPGQTLVRLFADPGDEVRILPMIDAAITIDDQPVASPELIVERITHNS